MATERDVKIRLDLKGPDASAAKAAFKPVLKEYESLKEAGKRYEKDAVGIIRSQAEAALKATKVLREAAFSPNVTRQVKLDLEKEKAAKDLQKAYDAEKARQTAPTGIRALGAMAGNAGSGAAGQISSLLSTFGKAAMGVGSAVQGATEALSKLFEIGIAGASKASPYHAERLATAWDDVSAVIGRVFLPYLELATTGVRLLGDTLASILPSTDDVRGAMAPFQEVFDDLRTALQIITPAIKVFVKEGLMRLAEVFRELASWLQALLGITIEDKKNARLAGPLKSSFGAAAGTASTAGISDIGLNAMKAAFSATGAVGAAGVDRRNYLQEAAMGIQGVKSSVDNQTKVVEKILQVASKKISETINNAKQIAAEGAQGALEAWSNPWGLW